MTKLTLYYRPTSPPSRAVLLFIKYLGLDVELKLLDFDKREQYSEEFLKLNPAHEIPVLVDGDFILTESRAILQYLANTHRYDSDLYPSEPKSRARVDQRLSYDHVIFSKIGSVIRPILYQGIKEISQTAVDAVKESLTILDKVLGSSKYMAGEKITIADFSVLATITTLVECGYNMSQHSNLNRWFIQNQSLPGFEDNKQGAKMLADKVRNVVGDKIF